MGWGAWLVNLHTGLLGLHNHAGLLGLCNDSWLLGLHNLPGILRILRLLRLGDFNLPCNQCTFHPQLIFQLNDIGKRPIRESVKIQRDRHLAGVAVSIPLIIIRVDLDLFLDVGQLILTTDTGIVDCHSI